LSLPKYQPEKKPRGKELPAEDKIFNKMISGVRVIAEHVISGVKRLRIVLPPYRQRRAAEHKRRFRRPCHGNRLRAA